MLTYMCQNTEIYSARIIQPCANGLGLCYETRSIACSDDFAIVAACDALGEGYSGACNADGEIEGS